jgi:TonB family protein
MPTAVGAVFAILSLVSPFAPQAQAPPARQTAHTPEETEPVEPSLPQGLAYVIDDLFTRGAATSQTPGLAPPKVTKWVHATYTPEALRRRLNGDVQLRVRVGANGIVEGVRVIKSLDPAGLDQAAVAAAFQLIFEPGQLEGQPVATLGDVTMSFNLR